MFHVIVPLLTFFTLVLRFLSLLVSSYLLGLCLLHPPLLLQPDLPSLHAWSANTSVLRQHLFCLTVFSSKAMVLTALLPPLSSRFVYPDAHLLLPLTWLLKLDTPDQTFYFQHEPNMIILYPEKYKYFFGVSCYFSSFIYDYIYLGPPSLSLSFFSWWVW